MSARLVVDLDVPPYAAELDCWGKDSRVQWWGLVTWIEDVIQQLRFRRLTGLPCSGWTEARNLLPGADERLTACWATGRLGGT